MATCKLLFICMPYFASVVHDSYRQHCGSKEIEKLGAQRVHKRMDLSCLNLNANRNIERNWTGCRLNLEKKLEVSLPMYLLEY